jgi:beta-galactosidase
MTIRNQTRRRTWLAVLLLDGSLALGCSRDSAAPELPTRSDAVLGAGWRFLRADAPGAQAAEFDDSVPAWADVAVPHSYNAFDGQDGGSDYYRGVAWYRLHLPARPTPAGRRVYLQFDAANTVADVYVNGREQGQHRGGFGAFRFDVTDALGAGDNVLAVKVDNAAVDDVPPLSADFTFFGGLYRDVHLLEVADLHVDLGDHGSSGVYLQASQVSAETARLDARVRLRNAGLDAKNASVSLSLRDAAGVVVASFTADAAIGSGEVVEVPLSGSVEAPHLWQGREDPYLYTASIEVRDAGAASDAVTQPFGIRSFAVDPNTGFSLNGKLLDLHGVNRHQDRLDRGWAIGQAEHDEDMALIVESGATAVRLAHYEQAQYFYDLCDRAGLSVWAEIPLVDAVTDSAAFSDNARQQLTELIRQSYNHPSIMFWGIGNEQRTDDAATNALLADLGSLVHAEDPSRLSTYAHCCGSATGELVSHSDVVGYNLYYGWYTGTAAQFGPFVDTVHAARPDVAMAVSEYGAGAGLSQHEDPPVQPAPTGSFHPEEYQSAFHEANWLQMAARPYLWGKFVWNMFDFAVDTRSEGDTPGRNDKGLVSYDRKTKKDAFFWYKANWSNEPFVHITSRRFEPRTSSSIDVKVYSNLPSIALYVNGTLLGEQSSSDHIFRWPAVALVSGANTVEARAHDAAGATAADDSVVWTGP